jgi:uncharacterized protein YbaR (Trm112 family)
MKRILLNMLVCPACLPAERGLEVDTAAAEGDDIVEGTLSCPACGSIYPVRQGVACLDPAHLQARGGSGSKYETPEVLASYLWSHFGDILGDEEATSAYGEWAGLMASRPGMALDAGSAVGRFTFEMGRKSDFAVGVDNSFSFVRCARGLMRDRRAKVTLKEEGRLVREAVLSLPEAWDTSKVEFIVGDAQALPFRSGLFSAVASLNLVDKVPFPTQHLREICRLAAKEDAQFLFSDPFSWSEEVADEREWLGGAQEGPNRGPAMETVMSLLSRGTDGWSPGWRIERHGHIWWKIRTHANHFELIRSCYVKAVR